MDTHLLTLTTKEIKDICLSLAHSYNQLKQGQATYEGPALEIYVSEMEEINDLCVKLKDMIMPAKKGFTIGQSTLGGTNEL